MLHCEFILILIYVPYIAVEAINNEEVSKCVLNVECSTSSLECGQNLKPKELSHSQKLALRDICPSLFNSEDGKQNATFCCGPQAAIRLYLFLKFYQDQFTCPSCWMNFKETFCQLICSPNQGDFIKVINSTGPTTEDKELYLTVIYFISTRFRDEAIQSCRLMRGKETLFKFCETSTFCEQKGWLDLFVYRVQSLFDFRIGVGIINSTKESISIGGKTFRPMNERVYSCHEKISNDMGPCPCSECQETCDLLSNSSSSSINQTESKPDSHSVDFGKSNPLDPHQSILQSQNDKCSYFTEFMISTSSLVVITIISLLILASRSLLKRQIHHLNSQRNGFIWWIKGRGDDLETLGNSRVQEELISVTYRTDHET